MKVNKIKQHIFFFNFSVILYLTIEIYENETTAKHQ